MKTTDQIGIHTNWKYLEDTFYMMNTILHRLFKTFSFSVIAILLSILTISMDAQVNDIPMCTGIPEWIVGEDWTAELLESYTATGDRRAELTELLHADFMKSRYNGFYNWNNLPPKFYKEHGTWVYLWRMKDGRYRIWAGRDWAIGKDYQLHNSTCLLYVSSDYEWYFNRYPKLYYPTGEIYK